MSGALAGIITRGLLSARPAYVSPADAAKGGALHFATDTGDLWRWGGAAWDLVGNYLALGTSATTAAAGNDSRLSDARLPSGGAGGILSGTYPNPGFAADMATQAELDAAIAARTAALTAHTGSATGAHAATAIAFTPDGNIAATTVQAAIVEVRDEIPAALPQVATINFVIDGGGAAITTGIKGYLEIPFTGTIQRATLLADQAGSIAVDLWRDSYANYPPVAADTIAASARPTLVTASKSRDATLTGWNKAVTAGDILAVNVDSAATLQRVTLSLLIERTA